MSQVAPVRFTLSFTLSAALALTACDPTAADTAGTTDTADSGPFSFDDCADVPADQCAAHGCTAIEGYPLLDDGGGDQCTDYDSLTPLACMDPDGGCAGVLTIASDPDEPDALWFLTSGCMPEGWTFVESTEYPACE